MPLTYSEKLKTKQPIQIILSHDKTGQIDYFLEATSKNDETDADVMHHTLLFYGSAFVKAKAKEKQEVEVLEFSGKKSVLETGSFAVKKLVKILMFKAEITTNTPDNTYIVKEDWTKESGHRIKNKKGSPIDNVDFLAYEASYNAKNILTHQDMFSNIVELNAKAIYKNPTISLLLRLVEYGSSNYSPVFLEWYEEQFINPKDPYRALFGSAFKREYQQLKENFITNTGTPSPIIVAREQPLSCVDAKQETTTEPVVDEPKEVTEPVDTPLIPNSALNGQSVPASDPSDLLFEELASEVFFDDDDRDRIINRYNAWRHGQTEFKKDLLEAYGKCCAVTGCSSEEALEAAHIEPYSKTKNNDPTNGLLLRADIHTLFDRHLIGIDPDTMTVYVAPSLLKDYGQFDGKRLQLENKKLSPNKDALRT
ncbi:MAG: HNH endonuclease [Pseudanabaenaceae cyanobacterium]